MATTPHPITATVYDDDNTTLLQGARVFLRNTSKRTSSDESTTNSSGVAVFDLANLPIATGQTEPYEAGDVILIIAYHGNKHEAARYVVTGSSKAQTLYLNNTRFVSGLSTEKIRTLVVANTHASNPYYAKVYALDDGQLLSHVECLAGSTVPVFFDGLAASGGFVIERENNAVIVTVALK